MVPLAPSHPTHPIPQPPRLPGHLAGGLSSRNKRRAQYIEDLMRRVYTETFMRDATAELTHRRLTRERD
ncbi:unnamed protein product [Arctogadus glacialis]